MEGKVKWYNRKKGYGFIIGDDDKEYFIHYTALGEGTFIRDNDKVSFEPTQTDKGNQARNVKLVQKASEMEGAETSAAPESPAQEESPVAEEPAPQDSEDFGEEPKKEEAPAEEEPSEEKPAEDSTEEKKTE